MFFSVIVPVYNAAAYLPRTLRAIRRSDFKDFELIVVDDGSTDSSLALARPLADNIIKLEERRSPGTARNRGARMSKGDILFFIDADVEIGPQALLRVAQELKSHPEISAVFGSYDDAPLWPDFFSQFKNLLHYFIHQKARPESMSFWAGCGAIRRKDFFSVGGFPEYFKASSIEDVVLGLKLHQSGKAIRLLKDLQAKHLKRWSFFSLLKTDIFQRAIPWTRLAAQHGLPLDLNFKTADRLSAVCVWGVLFSFIFYSYAGGAFCLLFIFSLLALNRRLYFFFFKKRGLWFAVRAVLFHWFYLFYSSLIFALFLPVYRFNELCLRLHDRLFLKKAGQAK